MKENFTILFDLDGTLVDTAPDLIQAHNHVMKKFGHNPKQLSDIKSLAGRGAWMMMQRSFKNEITDEKTKKEMVDEFISFYAKNINNKSKPIKGIFEFLEWAKSKKVLYVEAPMNPLSFITRRKEAVKLWSRFKKKFDEHAEYMGTWHCIVGKNFGCSITHETEYSIFFKVGGTSILLFKILKVTVIFISILKFFYRKILNMKITI